MVADMVIKELEGLSSQGVFGAVKHFPGQGGVSGDSHDGAVTLDKSLEELMQTELVPFQKAVENGVSFVMVGHISVPQVVGDNTPASLSQMMVSNVLREQLGYQGIVITDAMNMGAITGTYTADQAAVMAVNAGVDMILMPQDYETAYNGLLQAVQDVTTSHIPVILLTAKTDENDHTEGYLRGADAYITKPFNAKNLELLVQNIQKSRKQSIEHFKQAEELNIKQITNNPRDEVFMKELVELIMANLTKEDFGVTEITTHLRISRIGLPCLPSFKGGRFQHSRRRWTGSLLWQSVQLVAMGWLIDSSAAAVPASSMAERSPQASIFIS